MLVEKNLLALLVLGTRQRQRDARAQKENARPRAFDPAYQLANYHKKRSARNTRNLIATLLGHGSRAARGAHPFMHIAMNVYLPDGRKAVRLKMARNPMS